jgi:hypothetical protein
MPNKNWNKRLGRKWKEWDSKSAWSGTTNTSREDSDIELLVMNRNRQQKLQPSLVSEPSQIYRPRLDSLDEDDLMVHPMDSLDEIQTSEHKPLLKDGDDDNDNGDDSTYSDDGDDSDGEFTEEDEERGLNQQGVATISPMRSVRKKNFVSALLDSTIPQDLRDNTVGIIKGDYVVEKKTLLHHAATSDSYDLFSRFRRKQRLSMNTTPKDNPSG